MGAFKVKEDLPQTTRQEIERILAIDPAARSQSEMDFLTALAPYLTNEVHARDANGLILQASGNELPTGDSGFKKGASFICTGPKNPSLYINDGDNISASWKQTNLGSRPSKKG